MVRIAQIGDRGEIVGRLDEESMLELVTQTATGGFPIYLWIRFMSEEGHFYFRDGKMVAAASRSLRGKQAAYNFLAYRAGIFRLVRDQKPPAENVEIVWSDFELIFIEELKKLLYAFIPGVEGKFVFKLSDFSHQELYYYEEPHSAPQLTILNMIFEAGLDNGFKVLVRRLEDNITEIKDDSFAAIFYIPELRYFISVAGGTVEKDKIFDWVRGQFIPLARDAVSVALVKADRMAKRASILAIIPDSAMADQVVSPLSSSGYRVWLCSDGFEGLVRVEDYRPDVILINSKLDRISASDVYQRLKRKEFSQMIPVISMVPEEEAGKNQAEPSGDYYLSLPFSGKTLAQLVENILELK